MTDVAKFDFRRKSGGTREESKREMRQESAGLVASFLEKGGRITKYVAQSEMSGRKHYEAAKIERRRQLEESGYYDIVEAATIQDKAEEGSRMQAKHKARNKAFQEYRRRKEAGQNPEKPSLPWD